MSESEIIHFAADLSFLHTDYLWRIPGSWVGYDYYSTSDFYEDIARIAQRGVMDMLFFGDTGGTPEDYGGSHEAPVRYGAKWPRHDMAPMIPLMAKQEREGRRIPVGQPIGSSFSPVITILRAPSGSGR